MRQIYQRIPILRLYMRHRTRAVSHNRRRIRSRISGKPRYERKQRDAMTRWQVDNRGARRLKQLRAVAPGVVRNRIRQADKRTGVLPKQGVQLK